jgi:hypothetical protein
MLPPLSRQMGVKDMIEGEYYFVLHAPRHFGKTTFLRALTEEINSQGQMYALYCSLEGGQDITDVEKAMTWIAAEINKSLRLSLNNSLASLALPDDRPPNSNSSVKIFYSLNRLCLNLDKDLVVFFDEADCLSGAPLVLFLAQIRSGFNTRYISPAAKFPRSMALVGQRDIRVPLAQAITSSTGLCSAFNIVKETFVLANFTRDEIKILYDQHTEASGQTFLDAAIDRAWYWSEGQPWLVNALASESVVKILNNDYSRPITSDIMDQAALNLIKRRGSHLDCLLERFNEPRVRAVMKPSIFRADFSPPNGFLEDIRYTEDLGILSDNNGSLQIANPIYHDIFLRALTQRFEAEFEEAAPLVKSNRLVDGQKLDMTGLLKTFQKYWRDNSAFLEAPYGHKKALPFLVINAFFQKVLINDVKYLRREYALGQREMKMVLYIDFMEQVYPMALQIKDQKSWPDSLARVKDNMDICGSKEGWLVIFDNESEKSWDEKISWQTTQFEGSTIHIVGC